jgi:hypothetical protein
MCAELQQLSALATGEKVRVFVLAPRGVLWVDLPSHLTVQAAMKLF